MASATATRRQLPVVLIVVGAITVLALIAGLFYLSRPSPKAPDERPSTEATAYLPHLVLSDVGMKATENFMKQQVVEVVGKISNTGTRPIEHIDVYCIFSGINGNEVYRERVPIVASKAGQALGPNQTRAFRLPFDSLPDTWNQAMPRLVIAKVVFAR